MCVCTHGVLVLVYTCIMCLLLSEWVWSFTSLTIATRVAEGGWGTTMLLRLHSNYSTAVVLVAGLFALSLFDNISIECIVTAGHCH